MRRSALLAAGIVLGLVAAPSVAEAARLITSRQIKDHTIQLRDISASAQRSLQGRTGPRGPAGTFAGLTTVRTPWGIGDYSKAATCPAGTVVVSGGIENIRTTGDYSVIQSYPTGNGWLVEVVTAPTTAGTEGTGMWTYAVCAR